MRSLSQGASAALCALFAYFMIDSVSAATCPTPPPPDVHLERRSDEVSTDTTRSAAELGIIARRLNPASINRLDHVLGVTVAQLSPGGDVKTETRDVAPDQFCAWATSVTVSLGYARRIVFVAREAAGDPCVRDVVLEHEMRHVGIDNDVLERFPAAFSELARRLAVVELPAASTAKAAERQLSAAMQARFDQLLAAFNELRDRLQRELETPAEIERVKAACNGEVGRIRQTLEQRSG